MSFSTLDIGTIGIIVVGLAAVVLILALAIVSLVNRRHHVGN